MTKGIIYKLNIVIDIAHGWTTDILEMYIPEEKIAVNVTGAKASNDINCFSFTSSDTEKADRRYKDAELVREVSIENKTLDKLRGYIAAREAIDQIKIDLYHIINDSKEKDNEQTDIES